MQIPPMAITGSQELPGGALGEGALGERAHGDPFAGHGPPAGLPVGLTRAPLTQSAPLSLAAPTAVPEPGTSMLLALGLLFVAVRRGAPFRR
jgi:hypothetical protein